MSTSLVLASQTLIDKQDWPPRSFSLGSQYSNEMKNFNTSLPLGKAGIIVELYEDYSKVTLYNKSEPPEYKQPLFPKITGSCQFSEKELVCNMDFDTPITLRFVPDDKGRLKMYSLDDTFLTLWGDVPHGTALSPQNNSKLALTLRI